VLWSFKPGRAVRTRKHELRDVYVIRWLVLSPVRDGRGMLLLAGSSQTPDYPMQVAALDGQGRVLREYWHAGHFPVACVSRAGQDGRAELFLPGIANGFGQSDVVVLDVDEFGGASTEPNLDYQLLGFDAPREVARILLPGSTLGERGSRLYGIPALALCDADGFRDHVIQDVVDRSGLSVEFQFGPRLAVRAVVPADGLRARYRTLIAGGQLPAGALERDLARMRDVRVLTPWREPTRPASPRASR
jgi:hypothetical protein